MTPFVLPWGGVICVCNDTMRWVIAGSTPSDSDHVFGWQRVWLRSRRCFSCLAAGVSLESGVFFVWSQVLFVSGRMCFVIIGRVLFWPQVLFLSGRMCFIRTGRFLFWSQVFFLSGRRCFIRIECFLFLAAGAFLFWSQVFR